MIANELGNLAEKITSVLVDAKDFIILEWKGKVELVDKQTGEIIEQKRRLK